MTTTKSQNAAAELALRAHGMTFPEVTEDFPWGHRALKVRGKAFVFMGVDEDGRLFLSAKLPHTHGSALMLPFAEPTGYGLGKSGWVSAGFAAGEEVPVALLCEWLEESYRAIAPKKLVALLDGGAPPAAGEAKKAATKKKPVARKSAPMKKAPVKKAAAKTKAPAKKAPVKKAPAK